MPDHDDRDFDRWADEMDRLGAEEFDQDRDADDGGDPDDFVRWDRHHDRLVER